MFIHKPIGGFATEIQIHPHPFPLFFLAHTHTHTHTHPGHASHLHAAAAVTLLREELGRAYANLEAPDPGLADYLVRAKLTKLFPRTLAASRDDAEMSHLTKRIPMDAYFAHLSVLNQLVTVAKQILHDLESLSNHKYIAHQVALLYQCLSLARSPVDPFRAELEGNFSSIKRAAKGLEHKPGRLPIETAAWLQSLLKKIIEAVHAMPDIYRGPLRPVIRYLKSTETGSF